MGKYYIFQDQKRCIGCYACELHCKTKNNAPEGAKLCRIVPTGPQEVKGVPRMHFVFMPCFHCEEPWCVYACPTGAMTKRSKDGIVYVKSDLCVGCKNCITACPWGVPQWNSETGKVMKCDYCMDRIDQGLQPACVTGCTTGALKFISPSEASQIKREKFSKDISPLKKQ